MAAQTRLAGARLADEAMWVEWWGREFHRSVARGRFEQFPAGCLADHARRAWRYALRA